MATSPKKRLGATWGPAPTLPIPDKLYFKMGEVADLVGVPAHILRYWEKEVPAVRPSKSPSNQRRYRFKDVELFREIRRLLEVQGFTLQGAKKRLQATEAPASPQAALHADKAVVELLPAPKNAAPQRSFSSAKQGHELPTSTAFDQESMAPPSQPIGPTDALVGSQRLQRLRTGLRDLIRMAGEEA